MINTAELINAFYLTAHPYAITTSYGSRDLYIGTKVKVIDVVDTNVILVEQEKLVEYRWPLASFWSYHKPAPEIDFTVEGN